MLGTVYLNDQLGSMAIEINDILINGFLALKSYRIGTKEIVPQVIFLRCGMLTHILCQRNQIGLIWQ